MDYKQKYEKALARARKWAENPTVWSSDDICQKIFPELKESEDERIRKSIIWFLKTMSSLKDGKTVSNEDFDSEALLEWAAWLEKQGEQKPVIPKFRVGDFVKDANYHGEPIYEIVGMDNKCYICEYRGNKSMGDKSVMHFAFDNPYLRLVEQKPIWNEEDEVWIDRACMLLDELNHLETLTLAKIPSNVNDIISHLKSLRPQKHWKPSEEEINALTEVAFINESAVGKERKKVLEQLLDELKTLRDYE